MAEGTSTGGLQQAVPAEFATLAELFGETANLGAGADPGALDALKAVQDELALAGLSAEVGGVGGTAGAGMNVASMAPEVQLFIVNFIKDKVLKIIRELYALAQRYIRCTDCIRRLQQVIALFRQGQYLQALYAAYQTFTCFRQCSART